jgi:hypothetical protein
VPTAPATPTTPSTPSTPTDPATPSTTPTPPSQQDLTQAPNVDLASAAGADVGQTSAGIGEAMVFGDMLGGGSVAGPLPVRIGPAGQILGPTPVLIGPNGQRVVLGQSPQGPVDELLRQRGAPRIPGAQPGSTVLVSPPPGFRFADELNPFVIRLPLITRGAFKVAENDTPRPTDRVYVTYYYYDSINEGLSGPGSPRMNVHQEVLGFEKAFMDRMFSVGARLPYIQLTGTGLADTTIGDLTLTSKAVLLDDGTPNGNLLSAGLLVTIPLPSTFTSTISGVDVNPVLLQPYLGYILTQGCDGGAFFKGFTSLIVPTDGLDVTFLANDFAVGYTIKTQPDSFIKAIVPVLEAHINTPLNHRGVFENPVGLVDQVTVLGGLHTFFGACSLSVATGAPITGPRPFALQTTVQLNYRF